LSSDTRGWVDRLQELAYVERDFRIIKVNDLDLRPILHYLSERIPSHVFLCMLAAYITGHLRNVLTPLTYTDEHIPHRADPVSPAQRSPSAKPRTKTRKPPTDCPYKASAMISNT
jgi:hypothetical protein